MISKAIRSWLAFLILCALAAPQSMSRAQDTTPITIGVPQGLTFQFKDKLLPILQQAFPAVRLSVVETGYIAPLDPKSPEAVDKYYQALTANSTAADVLFVTPDETGIEATRAGYLLDLKPLVNADARFDPADYSPAVWSAYQWDSRLWALPALYDTSFLVYDPAVFDAANLTYPAATWTFDELATVARSLTTFESDKKTVKIPGLLVDDRVLPSLLQSLSGEPFSDPTAANATPHFAVDNLAVVVQSWAKLEQEGVVTNRTTDNTFFKIPLQIGSSFTLREPGSNGAESGGDTRRLRGALLPGGSVALAVYGFAVSAGTAQPGIAYQIAKALTAQSGLGSMIGGVRLARKSVAAAFSSAPLFTLSAENQTFVANADDKAVSPPLFGNYLRGAIDAVKGGQDALLALRNAETQVAQVLTAAEMKRAKLVLVVNEPTADSAASGKQTLKFGIFTGATSLFGDWKKAVDEFIAADPQVGKITLDFLPPVTSDYGKKLQAFPDNEDCFYPGYAKLDSFKGNVLSLDSFLDADPTFDRADVIGGALRDVQRDNHVYAFPLTLSPLTLHYNAQQFTQAGLALPTDGWKIDQFIDALKALKTAQPTVKPFHPYESAAGDYLFMLMAAYGALPIDYRTDPPTIDYTSPETVAAIRQVLDLAKNGYIEYSPTAAFIFRETSPLRSALFVDDISSPLSRASGFATVTFPVGSKYTPVSYTLSAAYISAKTPLSDACYRWIKLLSTHTELFGGIPVRRSLINAPRTEATDGKDAVRLYNAFADQMNVPNAVVISAGSIGTASKWLNRAFDNYVLHGADLVSELRDAEQYTKAYLTCIAEPDAEPVPNNPGVIFIDDKCANKIDPTFIKGLFAPQN